MAAKAGLPAEAVKAATDRITAELDELRSRKAEIEASRIEPERISELVARARQRLVRLPAHRRSEVLDLLDVRVAVVDNAKWPRLRITGVLPLPDTQTRGRSQGMP
ncbi:hypothetical protein ACQP2K_07555 [Microbispora siamensis]